MKRIMFCLLIFLTSCSSQENTNISSQLEEPPIKPRIQISFEKQEVLHVSMQPQICSDSSGLFLCPELFVKDLNTIFTDSSCSIQNFDHQWNHQYVIEVLISGEDTSFQGGCGPSISLLSVIEAEETESFTTSLFVRSFDSMNSEGFLREPVIWDSLALEKAENKRLNNQGGIVSFFLEEGNIIITNII